MKNILIQKPLLSEFISSFITEDEGEIITGLEDCVCIEPKIAMITFIVASLEHMFWVFLKESKKAE